MGGGALLGEAMAPLRLAHARVELVQSERAAARRA